MKSLLLLLLFCVPVSLCAQGDDEVNHGWGPGEIGDCLDRDYAADWFHTWHDGHAYYVVGNSLYVEDESKACYRKSIDFHFDVVDAYDAEESIILWTGSESYRYVYETGAVEYFSPVGALSSFLFYPVVSITALEGSYGCFGGNEESVTHDVVDADAALPSLRHEHRGGELNGRVPGGDVGGEKLTRILRTINADPFQLPSFSDFDITDRDIDRYAERFDTLEDPLDLFNGYEFYLYDGPMTAERVEFLSQLRHSFDTISPSTLRAALLHNYDLWGSTSSYLVKGTVVNERGDSLFLSFRSSGPDQPYNLPLTIKYRGVEFQTYNVELGRLLYDLLPENEWRRGVDQNAMLLVAIANYLDAQRWIADAEEFR